ncbi:hypothetical protein GYMLUDRAFT_245584 [Collybiopsis luxurians FD-317 M1]|uniref:F-box domain-containing protein n=1 Tax=Collybiopsis luxurians FD-317 M1 TaxID=944289 RepID=A0A0D0CKZ1_9AGAR|nr:hypothetical protein GYMLUDRAFT_245584 [Collybiopsis luxurians FD-317 M1]
MTRRSQRFKEKADASTGTKMEDVFISDVADTNGESKNSNWKDEDKEEHPRKRAKRSNRLNESSSEADYQASAGSSSKKKRVPELLQRVRGKFGLLERLVKDTPLDIVLEIFCHLDPGDLLCLARTTKDFRRFLMSKSSEGIWRTDRKGVEGLPYRPDDLNEPHPSFIVPFIVSLAATIWISLLACLANIARVAEMFCLGSTSKGVSSRSRDIVFHAGIAAQYKAEFETLETETERNEWIARKTDERLTRAQHANSCQRWLQARLDQQREELYKHRREEILERLQEIGWREEAEITMSSFWLPDGFNSHILVRQPKKLTDYDWNSIKTDLVEWLMERKGKRLERHRLNTLDRRYQLLGAIFEQTKYGHDLRHAVPATADIFMFKYFEDLIWDTPLDEEITALSMKPKFFEHFPSLLNQWRHAKIRELILIMRESRPGAAVSDLQLATTVFECTKCTPSTLMHYPQMFHHSCCFENPETNSARMMVFQPILQNPWSPKFLCLSGSGSRLAAKIVEACSLNPTTATIQDLHDANPLIECEDCNISSRSWHSGRLFMRWPSAIGDAKHRFHRLSINSFGDETQQIIASEPSNNSLLAACCVTGTLEVSIGIQMTVFFPLASQKPTHIFIGIPLSTWAACAGRSDTTEKGDDHTNGSQTAAFHSTSNRRPDAVDRSHCQPYSAFSSLHACLFRVESVSGGRPPSSLDSLIIFNLSILILVVSFPN